MNKKPLLASMLIGIALLLVFTAAPASKAEGIKAVPFYGLTIWTDKALCYFYTADVAEKENAKANGWKGDYIVGYISPQQLPGTIPLYRCYRPDTNDHWYTTDPMAKDSAVGNGWNYDCIAGYVLPTSNNAAGTVALYQKYDDYQYQHIYVTENTQTSSQYHYETTVCRIWTSAATVADINLTFPTGGESLAAGSNQEIKWKTTNPGGAVGLYLSPNGGLNWQSITVIPVDNTGSMTWKVPAVYSDDVIIRAEWVSGMLYPYTTWVTSYSGKFSIYSPSGPAPNPPSNLTGASKGGTEIDLTWKDNSSDESGFSVERKNGGGVYGIIAVVGKDKTSYADTSVTAGTTYNYRIRAWSGAKPSDPSNVISVSASSGSSNFILPGQLIKPNLNLPLGLSPAAPSGLSADAQPGTGIEVTWKDNSSNETGFILERKSSGGSYATLAALGAGENSYVDTTAQTNTAYFYRVKAVSGLGDSGYSNVDSTLLPPIPNNQPPSQNPPQNQLPGQTVVKLYPGKNTYTVNGELKAMDAAPLIVGGRTLLPVRYVVEPFGASVDYTVLDQKVKVVLGSNEVSLWIGKNSAQVNGEYRLIDSQNPAVTPIIVPPGRTMLPIRFIAENLGCQVDWNPALQEVTVSYPK